MLTQSLDRNCGTYPNLREPLWDGDDLIFIVEDHGNVHLYRVAARGGGAPQLVVGGERELTGFDVVAGRIAYAATEPTVASELFAHEASGARRLTHVGDAFAAGRELVAPERFTATSPDGTEVEAWIMKPAGARAGVRYPLLLNIHGGPFTQYGNRLFDEFQVYAGGGYAVVYCNPRGSSGYSEAWGRAIRGPGEAGPGWGTVDYDDCMAVVDEALRRFDFVDPERLGVMGGSYGGYMTSWIVGHTDRFKAALSERAVNNFVSMWGSSDAGWDFKGYLGSFLYEDIEPWLEDLAGHLRAEHPHAAADPALRERPALPHRTGRAALRHAAPAQAPGRDGALSGRVARAHALGQPRAPRAALRDRARVVRPLSQELTGTERYLIGHERVERSPPSEEAIMRVLVVGATGTLGRPIVLALSLVDDVVGGQPQRRPQGRHRRSAVDQSDVRRAR